MREKIQSTRKKQSRVEIYQKNLNRNTDKWHQYRNDASTDLEDRQ
jgi:hypothetical protein